VDCCKRCYSGLLREMLRSAAGDASQSTLARCGAAISACDQGIGWNGELRSDVTKEEVQRVADLLGVALADTDAAESKAGPPRREVGREWRNPTQAVYTDSRKATLKDIAKSAGDS
jgi:hypothetical protein